MQTAEEQNSHSAFNNRNGPNRKVSVATEENLVLPELEEQYQVA
jgi:hypothetical protein